MQTVTVWSVCDCVVKYAGSTLIFLSLERTVFLVVSHAMFEEEDTDVRYKVCMQRKIHFWWIEPEGDVCGSSAPL